MTVVVDSSVIVALLVDDGSAGRWAGGVLRGNHLVAPHLLHVEVANVLRRMEASGELSSEVADLAYADLQKLPVALASYDPLADRIWRLRSAVTAYDAWYVALAEALDTSLVTLDTRLAKSPGPTCTFLTP